MQSYINKKRISALLAMCLLLACCLGLPAAAAAPGAQEAQSLYDGVTVSLSNGQGSGVLRDSSRNSWASFTGGETITIQSESPVHTLYLVWDTPPAEWQLDADGTVSTRGTGGFLHEAIVLESPATQLTLSLAQEAYTLCDIYLLGEGTLPGWVQLWQPTLQQADLLLLPTHADDEHLFFGGIMPTYAGQRGLDVQVVYMTNHWGERYRPHELLDGLWTVGITAYPVMGPFPDLFASKESLASAEEVFGHEAVLQFQVELLRRFQPLVVVGHDLNGEYGHGAHMLNALTLTEALPLCGDETQYPESAARYGVWTPHKVYLHLYEENEITMDWDIPLARFDGKTGLEMATEGFAKHTSQQGYFKVTTTGERWEDCRLFGLYHTTVGPDVAGDDLFENIDLDRTPEPEPEPEPTESTPASTPSGPASLPVSSTPAADDGENTLPWVWIAGGAALVLVIAIIVVAFAVRRRKQRRRRAHSGPRTTYRRR